MKSHIGTFALALLFYSLFLGPLFYWQLFERHHYQQIEGYTYNRGAHLSGSPRLWCPLCWIGYRR